MSLEKQIKDAWRAYKFNSNKCHEIAERVKNRKVDGIAYSYALPGETDEYDRRARKLREIEEYIAKRQKELNRQNQYNKSYKKENYTFNQQQIERTRQELTQ